ncbi:enoyl-(Acyl carrier protein) reductase domain-containing protein [Ditylenchus destructor]|uniref:Enoyl-(Acyl carrier protein) reductase domain-containing protein n=1 Tax=Ditylenchus destructor TaxID=166010 RepID=A0AAD4MP10_9BILA|nr:enoyl-(Acyl carrier protein) reductase domain-containing protein [Ditylenchus destructor]
MSTRFNEKVVIITGSSAGIGQAAALDFGKEGASVVIHGQNAERLDKTESQLLEAGVPSEKILKVLGSLEDPDTASKIIEQAVQKFGKIDVLVNNAGAGSRPQETNNDSLDNLDFIYKVNFRCVVALTQLALPYLEKTKGNVVNVSSVGGQKPFHMYTFYASLKAALDHFTRCYADKYGPKGVRINSVNPGPIRTYIQERTGIPGMEQIMEQYAIENTSLRRFGESPEVSKIITFLASNDASYVTGALWVVDGGMLLKTPEFAFP